MPAAPKKARSTRTPAQKSGAKKPTARKTAAKTPRKSTTSKPVSPKPAKAGTKKVRKAAKVVRKVMKSVKGEKPKISTLFAELESLATYIQDAKKEIAALSPDQVKDDFLPTASDELDAIVEATADATNSIMDATEIIEEVMSSLEGKPADDLLHATTSIYEACTFQDITGQRITKVVGTLKDIEDKVDGLLNVFTDGKSVKRKKKTTTKTKQEITDEDLLNGPQSADKAKSQAEIDALLASFN